MRERFREYHAGVCSECGYVARYSDQGTFIRRFFLPDMCPGCGEHMAFGAGREEHPHWIHRIVKEEFIPAVRTHNPLTWLRCGSWEERDRSEWPA